MNEQGDLDVILQLQLKCSSSMLEMLLSLQEAQDNPRTIYTALIFIFQPFLWSHFCHVLHYYDFSTI